MEARRVLLTGLSGLQGIMKLGGQRRLDFNDFMPYCTIQLCIVERRNQMLTSEIEVANRCHVQVDYFSFAKRLTSMKGIV